MGPSPDGEEVGRSEHVRVGFEKTRPACLTRFYADTSGSVNVRLAATVDRNGPVGFTLEKACGNYGFFVREPHLGMQSNLSRRSFNRQDIAAEVPND